MTDNVYDNLTRRAYTTPLDKLKLGAGALLRSRGREGAGREGGALSSLRNALSKAAILGLVITMAGVAALGPAPVRGQGADGARVDTGGTGFTAAPTIRPVELRPATATAAAFRRIGELWIQGVDREAAVEEGLAAVSTLRARLDPPPPAQDRLLRAYRGSFLALRSKHGRWPGERLRNLRDGNAFMDAAVAEAPDDVAVRYIRLMSGFYLPGFFGRGEEVDADMAALIRLLPDRGHRLPAELVPEVVYFVLEHGHPTPIERAALGVLLP